VRDRLWIWTHVAGAHNACGLPRPSRMTPAEGALYLGVPNLFMVTCKLGPTMPFDPYAVCFKPFKRVIWSIVGASGRVNESDNEHVFELARRFPNIAGFIMDDFFRDDASGCLSVEQLKKVRDRLVIAGRKRDLYVVWYDHQLKLPVDDYLTMCDKITFWTWEAKNLKNVEQNFERLEKRAPRHGKLLGCYMWDYPHGKPMPLASMKKQCALGLRWLREKRIEGMIFLASNICDLELETVEWTRQWIADVGSERISG